MHGIVMLSVFIGNESLLKRSPPASIKLVTMITICIEVCIGVLHLSFTCLFGCINIFEFSKCNAGRWTAIFIESWVTDNFSYVAVDH